MEKRLDENNRTERYWTGTVLPHLITSNKFSGVNSFLNLLSEDCGDIEFHSLNSESGVRINLMNISWDYDNFQLTTELWHARDFSHNREYAVPDIVLLLENKYLIVCEGKFFQKVKEDAIEKQVELQKKSIADILETHKGIEYYHHCFIYGGNEKFKGIKGVDTILTWEQIYTVYKALGVAEEYYLKVLENGIQNYKTEFPEQIKAENYYVKRLDFVDLVYESVKEGSNLYIGLGNSGNGELALENIISAAREELEVLNNLITSQPSAFTKRPEFLTGNYPSALEYLIRHSNRKYMVDYATNGSGDDKSKNEKWINGTVFVQHLKRLLQK